MKRNFFSQTWNNQSSGKRAFNYMCTQFLHAHSVFCLPCFFEIIECIQFKIAFPWVCKGEMQIA